MSDWARYTGQAVAYAVVAALIGIFASWPRLPGWTTDAAQLKLSFVHGAQRREECRRLTSEEIARLPANQKRPSTCGRERVPIRVQLLLDGRTIYDAVLQPTGLAGDGPAQVYQRFQVQAGRHEIVARLRDSPRPEGFDHESTTVVDLAPLQSLAIDFKGEYGAFVFR